jgi:hypothetical protein
MSSSLQSLVALCAVISLTLAAYPIQWVLEFQGYCVSEDQNTFYTCTHKATSQTLQSTINSDDGVTTELIESFIGPVALWDSTIRLVDSNAFGQGNMTFGSYSNTHASLKYQWSQVDDWFLKNDPVQGGFLAVIMANITSATGVWAGARGFLTFSMFSIDGVNSTVYVAAVLAV